LELQGVFASDFVTLLCDFQSSRIMLYASFQEE
jgi:hypothetical protein